jgi:hypothetical protein
MDCGWLVMVGGAHVEFDGLFITIPARPSVIPDVVHTAVHNDGCDDCDRCGQSFLAAAGE